MTAVVFYFQVHQPYRIRRYSVFDTDPFYFDNEVNRTICERVANKCYRPATRKILELVRRYEGRFRVAYAITGTALEQFEQWTPDVIEMFQELADTGAAEFIGTHVLSEHALHDAGAGQADEGLVALDHERSLSRQIRAAARVVAEH